jgi:hypothetical protein
MTELRKMEKRALWRVGIHGGQERKGQLMSNDNNLTDTTVDPAYVSNNYEYVYLDNLIKAMCLVKLLLYVN